MSLRDKDEWRSVHQPFELAFHTSDNYRWHDDKFLPEWHRNFGGFAGLASDSFGNEEMILDVGCGSRPSLESYFTGGIKAYIEPLAPKYWEIPEVAQYWTEKAKAFTVTRPAEIWISSLAQRCALVNCWNVLDHCFDWRLVLTNILSYLAPGGMLILCTDTEPHGAGHPGIDDPADMINKIVSECRLLKLKINHGVEVKRDITLLGVKT